MHQTHDTIAFRREQLQNVLICVLDSENDWMQAGSVLKVLRSQLDCDAFAKDRSRLIAEGYHLIGVRMEEKLVAVASYVITPHPVYFRELQVHDMATLAEHQSKGFGRMLLAEIERIASEQGCGRCYVNSRKERSAAHEFYRKNGYSEYSVGFVKEIAGR